MKNIFKLSLVLLILLGCLTDTSAQFKRRKKPTNRWHSHHLMYINNIRVTGMLGLSSYYGDLCDNIVCFRYRPGITVGGYYRYNTRFTFRGDLTYLRLSGDDAGGPNARRNLSFRSPNIEVAVGANYDIIPFERNYNLRAQYTPYVFAELGIFYFNPKGKHPVDGKWYALRPLMTEGNKYSSVTFSIPFGGGIRYKINSYLDLSFEMAYRKTFTDYLDDVSTVYKNNASFSDQQVAAALADKSFESGLGVYDTDDGMHWRGGHQRGNPNRKDGYFLFGFKVEYMIKTTQQLHTINSMPRFRHKFPGMHRKYR